jgi:hypothetical protein
VLPANALPFINRFPEKPLIWNVCWKTALYFLVASLIHYLEHLYDFWKEAHGLAAANQKLLAEIVWPHFWAIQILLAVLILMYCIASEFARVIGEDKLKAMFFGPLRHEPGSMRSRWRISAGSMSCPLDNALRRHVDHESTAKPARKRGAVRV